MTDLEVFTKAYIEAAFFTSNDENGNPLDEHLNNEFYKDHIEVETLAQMKRDAAAFYNYFKNLIKEGGAGVEAAGHDFWYTRNGHGTGFWDGDWPEVIGDILTKGSKIFGEYDISADSVGLVYSLSVDRGVPAKFIHGYGVFDWWPDDPASRPSMGAGERLPRPGKDYWTPRMMADYLWSHRAIPKGVSYRSVLEAARLYQDQFAIYMRPSDPERSGLLEPILEDAIALSNRPSAYRGGAMDWFPGLKSKSPGLGINLPEPKFNAGRLVMTPGAEVAIGELEEAGGDPSVYLERHLSGDWGEIYPEDKAKNDRAVIEKGMILSAYTLETGKKIWIITDPGHAVTTFLLPGEY